jgi:hypothetical protein
MSGREASRGATIEEGTHEIQRLATNPLVALIGELEGATDASAAGFGDLSGLLHGQLGVLRKKLRHPIEGKGCDADRLNARADRGEQGSRHIAGEDQRGVLGWLLEQLQQSFLITPTTAT